MFKPCNFMRIFVEVRRKTLSQNSGTSCLHQALEAAAWRLMASADERQPLATLTTAHAASNEVSERRGREGWCARSLSDLVERATATQSFVIYTPHELHTTFPRATRELRARLNIEVSLNMPSPRALAPQKPTAQTVGESLCWPRRVVPARGVQFSAGPARAAAADDRNGGCPRPRPSHRYGRMRRRARAERTRTSRRCARTSSRRSASRSKASASRAPPRATRRAAAPTTAASWRWTTSATAALRAPRARCSRSSRRRARGGCGWG